MSFIEITRTLRSLTQAPGRLFLTLLGIVIGSAAIVLVMSLLEGGKSALIRTNQGVTGADLVVVSGKRLPERARLLGRPELSRADGTALAKTRLLQDRSVHADASRDTRAYFRGKNKRVRVVSGNPRVAELYRVETAKGRFLVASDLVQRRRVCVVGDEIYEELLRRAPLDRELALSIDGTRWQIVGVLKKKIQMGMYGGPDANVAVIPLSTFRSMFGRIYLSDMVVKADNPLENEALKKRLFEVLGSKYRFDPTDERALQMWDTYESQKITINISLGIQIFLGVIGGLTLLIGGVGVANIMYAVVKHRTKEIGVQMALGARRSYVLGPLVLESLALTAFGGAIGVGFGYGLVRLLGFLQTKADSDALEFMGAPTFSPAIAATTVLLLGTIGFLAGYFPSRRAVAIQPAEALRYE